MKRLLLYVLIIALVLAVPVERVDVAKLRPVEVIAIYKRDNRVILATDTDDTGEGATVIDALENMRRTSPAVIYLDTAEFLLIEAAAMGEMELFTERLKDSIRVCGLYGEVDLKRAAKYLPVHGNLPTLGRWNIGDALPVLQVNDDRLKISENSKNST